MMENETNKELKEIKSKEVGKLILKIDNSEALQGAARSDRRD